MSRLTERDGRIAVRVGGCTKRHDPVFDKLAHYEDLEEAGRLIELPCKVGDYVWWRNYENVLVPLMVVEFEITESGITRIITRTEHYDYRYFSMDAFELGILKTTKAEAEAKLAELKEGGSDE